MCMQELEYAKPSRALGEVGQTRTWNLMLDVIAQSGRYAPGATWLDIALGRDPVQADGTPCVGNYTGCQGGCARQST
jgi:hypothetical protein